MEMTDYVTPGSWDAKGMDWENPDPQRADYAMAIRQALMERAAAARAFLPTGVFGISPFKAVSRDTVAACVEALRGLCPNFVNTGFEDYKDDLSDFPKMWTYKDLIEENGCELYRWAGRGEPCRDTGAWLKAMRNAINRLTVIKNRRARGTSVTRNGTRHDPPFASSIGDAMEEAMKAKPKEDSVGAGTEVYGWSGNTHWKCPDKRDDDDESDPDDDRFKDGYCGYAQARAFTLTRFESWLAGRDFDLRVFADVGRPEGPVPYSQVLDSSVFDSGATGLREGKSWLRPVRIRHGEEIEVVLGETDSIPRNGAVPQSEFDEDGNAVTRHSVKRGYTARMWLFLDYGVEGGFNFRGE